MKRIYERHIHDHFKQNRQMLFLVGPRQVGKTTLAKQHQKSYAQSVYLNWDAIQDRTQIISGQKFIEAIFPLTILRDQKPLVVFDEIHKYRDWKNYLKGFYDLYSDYFDILVTGSARLDIFQAGGDSLMGRYFQYRIHPFSVGELAHPERRAEEIAQPTPIPSDDFERLYRYGGFPNPFLNASKEFSVKWNALRSKQLFYEDIQNISHIHEVAQLEVLSELIKHQSGQLLNRSSFSKKIQVTVQTISRWIETLERFYFCFQIKPWSRNISRSLIKEPKIYLWDWSQIEEEGARFENFVASHLLKAVHFWNDSGLGVFGLYFLRDKDKKEVDFVICKNKKPWVIVEAKCSDQSLSKNISYFKSQAKASYAFQVVKGMDALKKDCFSIDRPMVVPAKTFLSQLV